MIHSGPPESAVSIAASTFAPLAPILKATAIVSKVIDYIRSKLQVEPKLILSLKYYQLRILASNRQWEIVMAACIV